mgnify:FL=1
MARPYAKLRGLMVASGETGDDLCRLLRLGRTALSSRFNNRAEWQLGEMYAIMDHYRIPHRQLSEIFPLNGKNE